MRSYLLLIVLCLSVGSVFAQQRDDENIFKAMEDELNRSKTLSMPGEGRPFYIAYYFACGKQVEMKGNMGAILLNKEISERPMATVKLLLGDYAETSQQRYGGGERGNLMPSDLSYDEIRRRFWLLTDQAYKNAVFNMADKKAHVNTAVKKERELNDWTAAEPITRYVNQEAEFDFNREDWEEKVRQLSAVFKDYPDLQDSEITLSALALDVYMKNSDGTTLKFPTYSILVRGRVSSMDKTGRKKWESIQWLAKSPKEIPSLEKMDEELREMCNLMTTWGKGITVGESYAGPVLVEGYEVPSAFYRFNSLLCSQVRKDNVLQFVGRMGAAKKIGNRVIDGRLTFTNDTKMTEYKGTPVSGAYDVDAEGCVPAGKTTLIEKGILKNFLNDRVPKEGIGESTGSSMLSVNGGMFGFSISAGVLHVTSSQTVKAQKLKEDLLKVAKKEGLTYAYIIRGIHTGAILYKVDVETGEESIVTDVNVPMLKVEDFRHLLGVSKEEVICVPDFMSRGHLVTVIAPQAVLLERLVLRPNDFLVREKELEYPLKRMSGK